MMVLIVDLKNSHGYNLVKCWPRIKIMDIFEANELGTEKKLKTLTLDLREAEIF